MSKINIDNKHGVPTVSSLQVAEHFGKLHKDVLKSIKNLAGAILRPLRDGLKIEPTLNGCSNSETDVPENQPAENSARCQNHFFESRYLDKYSQELSSKEKSPLLTSRLICAIIKG